MSTLSTDDPRYEEHKVIIESENSSVLFIIVQIISWESKDQRKKETSIY